MKPRHLPVALLMASLAGASLAQYKVVAPDGAVTYTDRPPVSDTAKISALEARGAQVVVLPGPQRTEGAHAKVDLGAMVRDLGQRSINELHIEAGEKLNGSLIREGLVDEFLVYLAPKLLGQGLDMASFGPLGSLAEAIALEFQSVERCGPDLRLLARVAGRDRF